MKSYRVTVRMRDGETVSNDLRFATISDAEVYGTDLLDRWTLPVRYDVEETRRAPTHCIELYPTRAVPIKEARHAT